MHRKLKRFAKAALPPFLVDKGAALLGLNNRWTGDYPDWHSAVERSAGYDSKTVFSAALTAARAVRDGEALWERDSACFHIEDYNWNLLACLMSVAATANGKLHVLDFGGAFGSTYMQHRRMLLQLPSISWNVVEQPHFVESGKKEFETPRLKFFENMHQCFESESINAVLLSGVLQYVERPYQLLDEVVNFMPTAIIIDRTPIYEVERITVQHVPTSVYKASYPCRFLERARVEACLKNLGSLSPWFASAMDPLNFQGIMASAATENTLL
ncbi:methyltransferase, TIGR04325 family [Piscinibacter sakaiensis]|uniref:methyltransferase, TIGR04325 family n=1 Tax=Piscinibacter sakaiensis TaxID=1547922 RepID=UPI003AB0E8E2